VVREDPERQGLLFAGTEFGIYFSADNGAHWQSLQLNLPATPVTDLAIQRKDLVLTTQGRGFWVLDDLTPVEWIAAGGARSTHALPPRPAYRGVNSTAIVWYTRSDTSTDPVTVDIRDKSGRLVTRSTRQPGAGQAARPGQDLTAALSRFDWNLRYDPPFQVPQGVGLFAALAPGYAGPQAPPGSYEVTVSSGSWKETQRVDVRGDPGSTATPSDYDAQLELALQVGARTRTLYGLLTTTRDLEKQATALGQRLTAPADQTIRAQVQSLLKELNVLQDALAQTRATGSQDTAPSRLDTQFVGLYGRVIARQGGPTDPERTRFQDIDPLLTKLEATMDGIKQTTLPTLNKLLTSRGLTLIKP